MRSAFRFSISVSSLLCFALALSAQDTRKVTEPHIPSACVTLNAGIAAEHGIIAPEDEQKLDTERIQHAIDNCAAGKAVVLRANGQKNVFLTAPIALRAGVTLVVDSNTALVASRAPRLYDLAPGSCGIISEHGHGCKPLILGDGAKGGGIMGLGSIDGRGGAKLLGQDVTWWDLAHEAKITDKQQNVPVMIALRHADDFTMYKITLRNSPNFHVGVNETDGFTAWGVKIMTPKTARNTDGIDPGSSRNVTIAYCSIHTGDDDVAVKSGKAGPSSNISVLHNHFYTGHGMSIGSGTSGGVDHMLVDDLTIDGADNGIRIKSDRSRGGLVHDLLYRDICIRDTKNPLVFTPLYTTFTGDQLPVYRDITLENVHVLTAGSYTFLGLDAEHKLGVETRQCLCRRSIAFFHVSQGRGDCYRQQARKSGTKRGRCNGAADSRLNTRRAAGLRIAFCSLSRSCRRLQRWQERFFPKTRPCTLRPTERAIFTPSSAHSMRRRKTEPWCWWLPELIAKC